MNQHPIIIAFTADLRIGAKIEPSAAPIAVTIAREESRVAVESAFADLIRGKLVTQRESIAQDNTISLWLEPAAPGSADFPAAFARNLEQQGAYAVSVSPAAAELLEFFDQTIMTAENRAKLIPELLALSEKDAEFLREEKRSKE